MLLGAAACVLETTRVEDVRSAWPAPADICHEASSSRWILMPDTLYVHGSKQRRGVEALCQFFFREFLQAGMLLRAPETTACTALKRSQGCREPV